MMLVSYEAKAKQRHCWLSHPQVLLHSVQTLHLWDVRNPAHTPTVFLSTGLSLPTCCLGHLEFLAFQGNIAFSFKCSLGLKVSNRMVMR
jgi:hypothetical protein